MTTVSNVTTEPQRAAWCCEQDCTRDATVSIVDPTRPYDMAETHACADHVEALGGGVEGNIVTPLEAPALIIMLLEQLNPDAYLDACDRSPPAKTIYAAIDPEGYLEACNRHSAGEAVYAVYDADGSELGQGPTKEAAAFDAVRSMVRKLQRDLASIRGAVAAFKAAMNGLNDV